ncbi:MAG: helix-turn-helix transcriptional regulator [Clostridia bacterium]|nr:helix-turn-helix transcriptional regulator [Clostridia bacterium]
MYKSLNENIKALRLELGISQVDVARKLCVSKQCVSNWENDNVLPSIEMLIKLADLFGVTTDYLLGRESNTYLDASGLTLSQYTHISELVKELSALNLSKKMI